MEKLGRKLMGTQKEGHLHIYQRKDRKRTTHCQQWGQCSNEKHNEVAEETWGGLWAVDAEELPKF
eukprot:3278759-Heterocapsa_arctica.AAC.1